MVDGTQNIVLIRLSHAHARRGQHGHTWKAVLISFHFNPFLSTLAPTMRSPCTLFPLKLEPPYVLLNSGRRSINRRKQAYCTTPRGLHRRFVTARMSSCRCSHRALTTVECPAAVAWGKVVTHSGAVKRDAHPSAAVKLRNRSWMRHLGEPEAVELEPELDAHPWGRQPRPCSSYGCPVKVTAVSMEPP